MTEENQKTLSLLKRRKRKKRIRRLIVILGILLFIFSKSAPVLMGTAEEYHRVELRKMADIKGIDGFIFREEEVLSTHLPTVQVELGRRVPANTTVGTQVSTPYAGVVEWGVDGLEEFRSLEDLLKGNLPDREELQRVLEDSSLKRPHGIRLITGYQWGFLGEIPEADAIGMTEGQSVRLRKESEELRGTIRVLENIGDRVKILVTSREVFSGLYKERQMSMEIQTREFEGLWIPDGAILDREHEPYVIQQSIGGKKEVPVRILLENEEGALVQRGSFTDPEGNRIPTLSLYDEILLNPRQDNGEE